VYDHNKPIRVVTYSQMPPVIGVPSVSLQDQPAIIDYNLTPSPERTDCRLNPLAVEFIPASAERDRQSKEKASAERDSQTDEVYSVD